MNSEYYRDTVFAPLTQIKINQGEKEMLRLIPMKEVVTIVSLSRPTIYNLLKEGKFPPPTRLTESRIAFRSDLIEKWVAERPFDVSPKGGLHGKP
jgi:prophage regulatory protein